MKRWAAAHVSLQPELLLASEELGLGRLELRVADCPCLLELGKLLQLGSQVWWPSCCWRGWSGRGRTRGWRRLSRLGWLNWLSRLSWLAAKNATNGATDSAQRLAEALTDTTNRLSKSLAKPTNRLTYSACQPSYGVPDWSTRGSLRRWRRSGLRGLGGRCSLSRR